ncbi:MAG TPA: hypothetical protein VG322_00590 [Candidatus Acidoferrales bacterium]|jgi:hypothetical protein|nr:hypothetical protein [Candidatus Acidoferrales bacterium]
MKRRIPGLHATQPIDAPLEGLFLVRVEWASYRWQLQKPYLTVPFVVLEPNAFQNRSFSGRLYCTERALWKLNWFLRDFGYDQQLLADDQVNEKALVNLRGVVRISHVTMMGRTFQNLKAFAPAADWDELASDVTERQPQESSHGL